MQTLLNLLAGVSLLVWGTHIVRTGILRLYGGDLRRILRRSVGRHRVAAFAAGIGVTGLIQSSTATALIVAAFAGQGLITTASALAVMLGADVGTSLVTVVLSFDLSWLAPLLIFVGVVLFLSRQSTPIGRFGRVLIGLGLIIFALQWIRVAAKPIVEAAGVKVIFASLTGDVLLDMLVAAVATIFCYSSLAVVLLVATLSSLGMIGLPVALGLVLGANLGSGTLGMLSTLSSPPEARRVTLGNFLFKLIGCVIVIPLIGPAAGFIDGLGLADAHEVVLFHFAFNIAIAVLFLAWTESIARVAERLLPARPIETDPGIEMLRINDEARLLSEPADGFLLVTVRGADVRYELRTVGLLSPDRHSPSRWRRTTQLSPAEYVYYNAWETTPRKRKFAALLQDASVGGPVPARAREVEIVNGLLAANARLPLRRQALVGRDHVAELGLAADLGADLAVHHRGETAAFAPGTIGVPIERALVGMLAVRLALGIEI